MGKSDIGPTDKYDRYTLDTDVAKEDLYGMHSWENQLSLAVQGMLEALPPGAVPRAHVKDTPDRYVKAMKEFFGGCRQDPKEILTTGFHADDYDEMIFVNDIGFVSFCAHHLVPFVGKIHFAYLPKSKIVGLSKIPRLTDALSKRPQVQEKLTQEIVSTFDEIIKPKGCGVMVEAYHFCMMIRGVKKETTYTKTTALRGVFKKPAVKSEFLDGVHRDGGIWP